jgi:small subunit ribosomal protein S6
VKRYEGLFILNPTAREEGVKEAIDKITAEINAAGGRVDNVQKMDKHSFARVSKKKQSSGFYVNVIFECPATGIAHLRTRFALNEDVFRVLFSVAPLPKVAAN